jgi:hypothetical protein
MRISLLLLVFLSLSAFQANRQVPFELSGDQELILPDIATYRQWPFMGNATIPDDRNNNKAIFPGIHSVFVDPDALEHRRTKGQYPDGTMVIMEVAKVDFDESPGGFGYFNNGGMDVLVQIKDRRRFSGSGWAYYWFKDADLKAGKRTATLQPKASCQSCHQVGAEEDELFIQYYPALAPDP